jgi:hypothetical protein
LEWQKLTDGQRYKLMLLSAIRWLLKKLEEIQRGAQSFTDRCETWIFKTYFI